MVSLAETNHASDKRVEWYFLKNTFFIFGELRHFLHLLLTFSSRLTEEP